VSPTKTVTTSSPRGPVALEGNGSRPMEGNGSRPMEGNGSRPVAGKGSGPRIRSNLSRAEAIDRLEKLRSVVPVFAQELVSARRQSAQLRAENSWLIEQVRQLQRGPA
jgi:hypothetical protein